jgi:hypothetical protein
MTFEAKRLDGADHIERAWRMIARKVDGLDGDSRQPEVCDRLEANDLAVEEDLSEADQVEVGFGEEPK